MVLAWDQGRVVGGFVLNGGVIRLMQCVLAYASCGKFGRWKTTTCLMNGFLDCTRLKLMTCPIVTDA